MKKLCDIAKRKCKITWFDKETEQRISEIAENADIVMRHKLGISDALQDAFLKPGLSRILYENYCLYDWNNMTHEFEKNYRSEILTERHRYEVEYGKKENQQLQ